MHRRQHHQEGPRSADHAYDAPDIGPLEFLLAVMRAQHLPMATRISAASAAAPFIHPRPNTNSFHIDADHYRCKIIIPDMPELFQRQGQEPRTPAKEFSTKDPAKEFAAEDPEQINENSQSFSSSASNRPLAQSGDTPVLNIETTSYPPTFIDYSQPPSPQELQEIKAAINRLRPDLAHLPIPEPRLCECGHWMFGPCPLGEKCREKSKLN
jgi:hypothetical protein